MINPRTVSFIKINTNQLILHAIIDIFNSLNSGLSNRTNIELFSFYFIYFNDRYLFHFIEP